MNIARPSPKWQRPMPAGQGTLGPSAPWAVPGRSVATATTVPLNSGHSDGPAPLPPLWQDLTWPFLIVLAYFFVDFARPQSWVPPLGVIKPGMFALGGGLLTLLIRRDLFYFPTRAKLMVAFLVLMAIGTPFATNRYWAFITTKDFALLLFGAVLPLMSFVDTYSRLKRLASFFILIHIPLALYGITHSGFGIGSFLGDENDFCLAINIVVPYVLFSFYYVRSRSLKIALLLTLGLMLLAITASKSRGGFVGLVAVAVYAWLASPRKLATLVLMVVVSVPVLALVPDSYWDEIKTIETSTENDDTGAQRLYLWGLAWTMFKNENPILGVGPTNFQWNSHKYESEEQQNKGLHVWGKGAHSLYFTLLPEEGLVGVALFLSILFVCFKESHLIRRAYKKHAREGTLPTEQLQRLYIVNVLTRANDAALVAYLVTGAFLSVLYYPHLWLQAGFGVALKRTSDELIKRYAQQPVKVAPKAFALPVRRQS